MKFSPDDPKLTAYVLGELDKAEATAIEQELKNSPALRQAVEEIRATAEFLKTEFAAEGKLSLSEQQKQTIATKVPPTNVIPMPKRKIAVFVSISAIAASVMAILAWGLWVTPKRTSLLTSNSEYRYAQNAEQAQRNALETQKKTEGEKAPVTATEAPVVSNGTQSPAIVRQEAVNDSTKLTHDGQLLFEQGKIDEAKPKLQEALKQNPANKAAQYYANLIDERKLHPQTADHELLEKEKIVDIAKGWIEPTKRESIPAPVTRPNLATVDNSGTLLSQNQKSTPPNATGNRVHTGEEVPFVPGSLPPASSAPNVSVNGSIATPLEGLRLTDDLFPKNYRGPQTREGEKLGAPTVTTTSGRSNFGKDWDKNALAAASTASAASPSTELLGRLQEPQSAQFNNQGKFEPAAKKHRAVGVTSLGERKKPSSITASVRGYHNDNYELEATPTLPEQKQYFRSRVPDRSGTARYPQYVENAFESVLNAPLSTVSIDVDTASYANVRRFLNQNQLPPRDAIRIEELVNYFSYDYPQPHGSEPFSVNMEVAGCPWNKAHRLVRVGIKGKEMAQDKRPPSNFVFLVDVSGSMSPSERLPLIKQALRMLVKKMTENDRIAMVVYASTSGVVLESTSCMNKEKILEAIDRLEAGGSTNGGQGIQKAYALAEENFIKGGVNRVILATDGDFNVGITDQNELINLIQKKAKSGVFLSALGVGTDNYKDALLQKLADKGNGNYHYLDTLEEAQKVLIQQMNGTLVTIAKDVKIQIEFNPAQVQSYRLIGYEKRIMEAQDFNNDKKDAGEIGAGHTVTALYEIIPTGVDEEEPRPAVDDLKYQSKPMRKTPKSDLREPRSDNSNELLTLKMRYKKPDGDTSKLLEFPLHESGKKFSSASTDFRFATAVAGFGMLLKDSEYSGNIGYNQIRELAESAKGEDKEGYRSEFINLVKKAKSLDRNRE